MTTEHTADMLRAAFDGSFALARDREPIATDDLIGIELGGAPHALRLAELAGVFADRKVVALPSASPDVVGMAGFRGTIVPVFDLATLLGYPRAPRLRWLALAAGAPVAFAFAELSAYLRVPREAITSSTAQAHVQALAHAANRVWPVISVGSLVDRLAQRMEET